MAKVQHRQEHAIRNYEMSAKDGLPVAQLRDEVVETSKRHCCITVLRASVGTVGAGVGAFAGMAVGPLICDISIRYLWPDYFQQNNSDVGSREYDWIVLNGLLASSLIGAGSGSIAGRKISTFVFDLIFGRGKVVKTPID